MDNRDVVAQILASSSKSDDFGSKLDSSTLNRYKNFLVSFIDNYEKQDPLRYRRYLTIVEVSLMAFGSAFGFFLIFAGVSDAVKLTAWIGYVILVLVVGITVRMVPDNLNSFYLEASKLRLINLCERLAAELALFDLVSDVSKYADDLDVITHISNFVPQIDTFHEENQEIIRICQDETKVFENARDVNLRIEKLNMDNSTAKIIHDATGKIVELCRYLFTGYMFSAKIYLRIIKEFEGKKVEILTSFSKYPMEFSRYDNNFGTSWVKARGNPSISWKCLETGKTQLVKKKNLGPYYDSTLTLCLPGRIGVLALTSKNTDAFDNKLDEWVEKSLVIATQVLVLRSLGFSKTNDVNR